jgi:hypothetical protein
MKTDLNKLLASLVELDKKLKDMDEKIKETRVSLHSFVWKLIEVRKDKKIAGET